MIKTSVDSMERTHDGVVSTQSYYARMFFSIQGQGGGTVFVRITITAKNRSRNKCRVRGLHLVYSFDIIHRSDRNLQESRQNDSNGGLIPTYITTIKYYTP